METEANRGLSAACRQLEDRGLLFRAVVIAAALIAWSAVSSAAAAGQTTAGSLTFLDCITTNSETQGCRDLGVPVPGGNDTPLDGANAIAVSPDGTSVYASAPLSSAIARFERDLESGELTYVDCVTTDSSVSACTPIAGVTVGGANSSLRLVGGLTVSADGENLYATNTPSWSAITQFSRDLDTGELTRIGCITGADQIASCTSVPDSTEDGAGTAFRVLRSPVLSADGSRLYAVSSSSDAILAFNRVASGALAYVGCLSANTDVETCELTDGATAGGGGTGLDNARDVALSPDGLHAYVASMNDDAVAALELDGVPELVGCWTSSTDVEECSQLPGAADEGNTSLRSPSSVVIDDEGERVYVGAQLGDAISWFDRDPDDGSLERAGCISGNSGVAECGLLDSAAPNGTGTGLNGISGLALSPDGLSLYASASSAHALTGLLRHPASGALLYEDCITSSTATTDCEQIEEATAGSVGAPFRSMGSLEISSDGSDVYTPSNVSDALAQFGRIAPTEPEDPPGNGEDGGDGNGDSGGDAGGDGTDTSPQPAPDNHVRAIIRGKRLNLNRKRVARVRISCPANEASPPCEGRLVIRTHRKVRPLGKPKAKRKRLVLARSKPFKAGAGKTRKVRVRLSKRNMKLLRRDKRARQVRAIVRVSDQAGNSAKVMKRQRARLPKRR